MKRKLSTIEHLGGLIHISIAVTIFLAVILRQINKFLKLRVPYNVFTLCFGMLLGVFIRYQYYGTPLTDAPYYELATNLFKSVYVPMIVFKTAYCIDYHLVKQSICQILIISFFVVPASVMFLGFTMRLVIDPHRWDLKDAVYFGSMCMSIYPSIMVHMLERSNYFTKQVIIILEGETLLSILVAMNIRYIVLYSSTGIMAQWYQFVASSFRILIISTAIGMLFGLIGIYLTRRFYNDCPGLMLITLSLAFVSHNVGVWLAPDIFSTVVTGAMMARERPYLSEEVNSFLLVTWKFIGIVTSIVLIMVSGYRLATITFDHVTLTSVSLVPLTYIFDLIGRLLSFCLFAPILSRVGAHGMSFTRMLICILGGVKSPFNLGSALLYADAFLKAKSEVFYLHAVSLFLLSNVVHGFFTQLSFQTLGLAAPPPASRTNMRKCMKYVLRARNRMLLSLKVDKLFCGVNWPLVENVTKLENPYRNYQVEKQIEVDEEEHDDMFRMTKCPKCMNKILSKPSIKEMNEMRTAARLKVLKALKVSFRTQYELCIISKSVLRALIHAVEVAMQGRDNEIDMEGFYKLFYCRQRFTKFVRKRLLAIDIGTVRKKPKNPFKLFCYKIVRHKKFEFVMMVIVLSDIVSLISIELLKLWSYALPHLKYIKIVCATFYFVAYMTEFCLKVFAGAAEHCIKDGCQAYFKVPWNRVDFCILIPSCISMIIEYVFFFTHHRSSIFFAFLITLMALLRLMRLIKLLRFAKIPLRKIVSKIDHLFDLKLLHAFNVGRSLAEAQMEVSDLLPFMIDNEEIMRDVHESLKTNRLKIVEKLLDLGNSRWDITIAAKTKDAVIITLNSMKMAINELRIFGMLDEIESDMMMRFVTILRKETHAETHIEAHKSPLVTFKEVPWLEHNNDTFRFLFNNVDTRKFDPGEVLIEDGEMIDGIYIIVRGSFFMRYKPNDLILKSLNEYGCLPVVDFLPVSTYYSKFDDAIVTGNCIGEIAFLTQRPSNCSITSYSYSEVYILSRNTLQNAAEYDSDPLHGMECRLWKRIALRISRNILAAVPAYSLLRRSKIMLALERAFVPNLERYRIFNFNHFVKDILIIEGIAVDLDTRAIFYGPLYIPRTCRKLILSNSKLINIFTNVKTILMVIPFQGVEREEVMRLQDPTAED